MQFLIPGVVREQVGAFADMVLGEELESAGADEVGEHDPAR